MCFPTVLVAATIPKGEVFLPDLAFPGLFNHTGATRERGYGCCKLDVFCCIKVWLCLPERCEGVLHRSSVPSCLSWQSALSLLALLLSDR